MTLSQESLAFLAKSSEEAARYDDMLDYMKQFVKNKYELSSKYELQLFADAVKYYISSRRDALNILDQIEEKGKYKENKHLHLILEKKIKQSEEYISGCYEIINLIDSYLSDDLSTATAESRVLLYRIKGDCYNRIAQFWEPKFPKDISRKALYAYQLATVISEKELVATDPIRLNLALNFYIFYIENQAFGDESLAYTIAKKAFDDAIDKLEDLDENDYRETTLIMQLLRDNLTLFRSN